MTEGKPTPGASANRRPLGEILRGHRLDAGFSQTELAARMMLYHGHLAGFERGRLAPNHDQLERFIEVFGLDPDAADELRRHGGAGPSPGPAHAEPHNPGLAPSIWNVPARNATFTGRDEILEQLHAQAADGSPTAIVPVALHGLGGVGKTQLALEYAHRFKADYEAVWWVGAEQLELIDAAMAELAGHLGLREVDSVPEAAKNARDALRRGEPCSNWLLIFDNADEPHELAPYLPDPGEHGRILVTSRNQSWARAATPFEVDVFTRGESIEHLTSGMPTLDPDTAALIAELVGDLPLAIESATAWLASTGTPAQQYLDALAEETIKVLSLNPPRDYPVPVAAVWNLSLARLRDREPGAARLMELAAFMDPDGISMELLHSPEMARALRLHDEHGVEHEVDHKADHVAIPMAVGGIVREILLLSLMRVDKEADALRVHRLVQEAIKLPMKLERQQESMHEVHRVLSGARPARGDIENPETWQRYSLLWPHLAPSFAAECDEPHVRELLIDRVGFLWLIGEYRRAVEFGRTVEANWEETISQAGQVSSDLLQHLVEQLLRLRNRIATALRAQGEFLEAHDLDAAVLEQQVATLTERHPHTLHTAASLAADLRGLGDFNRALEMDRATYERLEEIFGDDHPRSLTEANNLAVAYRLTGDYTRALEIDEHTLERRRVVLGPRHPYTLSSGVNLGLDLLLTGRHGQSVSRLRETVSTYRATVGETHPGALHALRTLADALRVAEQHEEALANALDAHALHVARLGPRNPDTLTCALVVAACHAALGDQTAAAAMTETVLAHYEESLGPHHPLTLVAANNLSVYMRTAGFADRARPLAERAAHEFARRLGAGHPYTLAATANLANCLVDAGELSAAERYDRATAAGFADSLGSGHPSTVAAEANLAATVRALRLKADTGRPRGRRLITRLMLDRGASGSAPDHSNARLTDWDLIPPTI